MTEAEETAVSRIREVVGEHFTNFAFTVMTEEGELFCDYTNVLIGEMLLSKSVQLMGAGIGFEDFDIEFEEGEEDYE